MQGLLDNGITNSLRTIDAANTGITAITALINQIKANLAQSLTTNNTTAVTTGTVSNLTSASSFATTVGKTITVSDGVTTATYTTVGVSTTVAQILAAVNNTALETVKASLNGSGQIILEAQGATAITVGGTIAPAELAQFGLVAGVTAAGVLSASRTTSAQQFDALRTQIDQLAADSGYNGVSLLNGGGLKVVFNQTSTSFQTIAGSTDTSTGLGVVASTGNFQTTFDINAALTNATAALTTSPEGAYAGDRAPSAAAGLTAGEFKHAERVSCSAGQPRVKPENVELAGGVDEHGAHHGRLHPPPPGRSGDGAVGGN